jgi:GT2 family glycosyltransferase
MVRTSIIIPNFNGARKTLNLISKLRPELTPVRDIVIVDDGSTDHSFNLIKEATQSRSDVFLIQQENKGRAAARNTGANAAIGDFFVFLDNDIIPEPGFLTRIEYIHALFPRAWITGSVTQDLIHCPHEDFLLFRRRLDYLANTDNADRLGLVQVNSFTTQQLGVARNEFIKTGGFDEVLRDCEDFELSTRISAAGGLIIHDTQNIVRHADYADLKNFVNRQIEYRQGRARLGQRRPELVDLFPEIFRDTRDISIFERSIRMLFRYSKAWDYVLNSSAVMLLPISVRFQIYDLIISSTFLLSDVRDEY